MADLMSKQWRKTKPSTARWQQKMTELQKNKTAEMNHNHNWQKQTHQKKTASEPKQ